MIAFDSPLCLKGFKKNSEHPVFNNSGHVGIGTTDPQEEMELYGDQSGSAVAFRIRNNNASEGTLLQFSANAAQYARIAFGDADADVGWITYDHSNDSMTFRVNAAERMRINSTGEVGIGTDNPQQMIHVWKTTGNCNLRLTSGNSDASYLLFGDSAAQSDGRIAYANDTQSMAFWTATTEHMRILSNGNVGIGTTNPQEELHVNNTILSSRIGIGTSPSTNYFRLVQGITGDYVARIKNDANSSTSHVMVLQGLSNTSTGGFFLSFQRDDGADCGEVTKDGALSVAYSTSSDARLKTKIRPPDPDEIIKTFKKLHAKRFAWKDDPNQERLGFIAQEVLPVYPQMVIGRPDDRKSDGSPKYMSIDYARVTPLLVEMVHALMARVEKLES